MALAASYVRPDPSQPLRGLLELRDGADQIADGFDERRLTLEVNGGNVSQPPSRRAPGLYGFEVTAPPGSGGREMHLALRFDGKLLASRTVPIGVDRWVAEGDPVARGGCNLGPTARGGWLIGLALMGALRLRRRYIDTK